MTAFLQSGDSLADWLYDMKSDYTPGDELALYCLSRMYLQHIHVHTKKLYWTTVVHTWGDSEETIMAKCKLSLVYMGPGKYGEFITLNKKDTDINMLTENTSNTATSSAKLSNVSTENDITSSAKIDSVTSSAKLNSVSTENEITSREKIDNVGNLSMVSTENNITTEKVSAENTSKDTASNMEQGNTSVTAPVSTENDNITKNVPVENNTRKGITHENSSRTLSGQAGRKRRPKPKLVDMVRAAESAKSTRSMCAQKQINYADLNTGIDSEPDHSPPRKKKRDIVAALREPSQTVLSAHQQYIT